MYISYNWLKDFVKLPSKIKPEEIATELTNRTVEVEGLVKQADQFAKVVVGKVIEVKKHPNADRLRLVIIDVKKAKLNIVCGAPNVAVGQSVPVALVGAVLPTGLEIKPAEIRGEKSEGMICAEDELGLGRSHEGIIVLRPDAKAGEPFAKYLKADDIVLEVDNKSLSNRPDLWSHYGLARELSAIFNLPLKPYDKVLSKFDFLDAKAGKLEIRVEDKERCPRYMAVKIDNVSVQESPEWLKQKLVAVHQRPINNLVDLTNYVMMDVGQPLHAFSADKVKKIVVRRAVKNEVIETLDEKERVLDQEDLVITDGKQPIAIAGVMGGKNSEIGSATKTLILEAANFQAVSVRRTSQKLGLRSESSMRFEKSLDPQLTKVGLLRFLTLLKEICPEMKVASALIDIDNSYSPMKEIELDLDWLADKIGQEIPKEEAVNSLKKLGFVVINPSEEKLKVAVPSWRATKDVSTREDLAEEVLRLYGYSNIVSQLPVQTLNLPEVNQERTIERKTKNILALKHCLTEAYSYSFLSEEQLAKLNIDFFNYLRLANPLAENQVLLRQSLVPGLVLNLKNNQAKSDRLSFFEIGSVFFNAPGALKKGEQGDGALPHQEKHLGLALASNDPDLLGKLKGIINDCLRLLAGYELMLDFSIPDNIPGWMDKKTAAKIMVSGKELGTVAALDALAAENINLKKPAVLAEINFSLLANLILSLPTFHSQEAPKYPPVIRDLAFVINHKILYNDLRNEIAAFDPLIKSAVLFDVYSGDKLSVDEKSLAFHINYQSPERTLLAEEVDRVQQKLISYLADKFSARLRNF